MQRWVLQPLAMGATTFDFARALRGKHATGHTWSMPARGATVAIGLGLDRATPAIAPAGGAWSNVEDMIAYVQLELAGGVAANGTRLVSEASLLKRRERYAAIGQDAHYGIGLIVDHASGATVIGHDGRVFGYYSRTLWLPEQRVGAVLLTNADAGGLLGDALEGYLLELLFDAAPKAETTMRELAAFLRRQLADRLAELDIPAAADASAALAPRYANPELGRLAVERDGAVTRFDFGEWESEVATHARDGKVSFVTITPGFDSFELAADETADGKRRLTLRDAQHAYAFVETP